MQHALHYNDSVLPSFLECDSEAGLFEINFTNDNILSIIQALDINKAHGYDDESIKMVMHWTVRSLEPYCPWIYHHSSWTKGFKTRQYGLEKKSFSRFVDDIKREVD